MKFRRIAIAVPLRPGATSGNSVTATRWADQLIGLGYDVDVATVSEADNGEAFADDADLIVALHARRCASQIRAAKARAPDRPVIVALTGTDLYSDLPDNAEACQSLDVADRLIVLQRHALDRLHAFDTGWRDKAVVIHQSVEASTWQHSPDPDALTVVVLSHLRDVKDPLLVAKAARALPSESRVRVILAGAAHTPEWQTRASAEAATNPRFEWLGEVDAFEAVELLAGASIVACTSLLEGGANVVSEAIAMGVPVVGTDIDGNRGLLGDDHPGLVPVGDVEAMSELLQQLEASPQQLDALRQRSIDLQWMTEPARERAQWVALLDLISESSGEYCC